MLRRRNRHLLRQKKLQEIKFPTATVAAKANHLPALLRRRRHLLRLRDGADPDAPAARDLPPARRHQPVPHRQHVQDHLGHRHDGRLRVRHRVLHRGLLGQLLREVRLREPRLRPVRLGLLDHGVLQRDHPAALLVQEGPREPLPRLDHLSVRQCRHVVRALRDHHHLARQRLPAVQLGLLLPDDRGYLHVLRHLRLLLRPLPPVRALPASAAHGRGEDGRAAGLTSKK